VISLREWRLRVKLLPISYLSIALIFIYWIVVGGRYWDLGSWFLGISIVAIYLYFAYLENLRLNWHVPIAIACNVGVLYVCWWSYAGAIETWILVDVFNIHVDIYLLTVLAIFSSYLSYRRAVKISSKMELLTRIALTVSIFLFWGQYLILLLINLNYFVSFFTRLALLQIDKYDYNEVFFAITIFTILGVALWQLYRIIPKPRRKQDT